MAFFAFHRFVFRLDKDSKNAVTKFSAHENLFQNYPENIETLFLKHKNLLHPYQPYLFILKKINMKSLKDFEKMHGIGSTRLRLGLTQQAFALELGISRSYLALCENGQRSLPVAALTKLAALHICMAATDIADHGSLQKEMFSDAENAMASREFYKQEQKCLLEAARCQELLDKMLVRYQQVRQCLSQVEMLIEAATHDGSTALLPGHLEMQRDSLLIKLMKCSQPAQASISNKIALLYAEAHLHTMSAEKYAVE
jgi:transcriptional regulator with XRE-family HTH domain